MRSSVSVSLSDFRAKTISVSKLHPALPAAEYLFSAHSRTKPENLDLLQFPSHVFPSLKHKSTRRTNDYCLGNTKQKNLSISFASNFSVITILNDSLLSTSHTLAGKRILVILYS